jgi:hypothetical protein
MIKITTIIALAAILLLLPIATTAFAADDSPSSKDGGSSSSTPTHKTTDSKPADDGGTTGGSSSGASENNNGGDSGLTDLIKKELANGGPQNQIGCRCLHESGSNNNNDGITDKIDTINSLFRSGGHHKGSITIPTIPQMQFPTTTANGTTANVTIAVCDGIVPGPCLDRTTGQIIP